MSSQAHSTPIVIDNAVSPRLGGACSLLVVLAAASVVLEPLPFPVRVALLAVLAGVAYDLFRTIGLRSPGRCVRRIELCAGNAWRLTDGRGRTFDARLLPDARVTVPLVALRWRDSRGRRYTALLAPDAVDNEALRRLRVRLRFAGNDLLESRAAELDHKKS